MANNKCTSCYKMEYLLLLIISVACVDTLFVADTRKSSAMDLIIEANTGKGKSKTNLINIPDKVVSFSCIPDRQNPSALKQTVTDYEDSNFFYLSIVIKSYSHFWNLTCSFR